MAEALIIGVPSKGRIHDEVLKWFGGAGIPITRAPASRGYTAALEGVPGAEVRLLSASEVASSLESGALHIGITGLDLLQERPRDPAQSLGIIARLGFSRARVVVAVPDAWIDVDTIEDLREAAARYHERTRSRLRIATKFRHLTRRFLAAHGLIDYHIVPSQGATEGAPAAGAAELIVDITETGSTLAANNLRVLDDGVILESEAVIAGSLAAPWSTDNRQRLQLLLDQAGLQRAGAEFVAAVDEAIKS